MLLHELRGFLVGGVIGVVLGDGKAVGITGLGQQRLGLINILRDGLVALVAGDTRAEDGGGRRTVAVVDDLNESVLVHGQGQGLAHAHVVERSLLGVHVQPADHDAGLGMGDQVGVGFNGGIALGRDGPDKIGVAGQKHIYTGGVLGNDLEVDALEAGVLADKARFIAPPVGVALELEVIAVLPLDEQVLAGANGGRGADVVAGLDDLGAHHDAGRVAEVGNERGEGLGQLYGDFVLAGDLHSVDDRAEQRSPLQVAVGVVQFIQVGLGSLGVPGSAVGEADALAQSKYVLGGVFVGLPLGSQHGDLVHLIVKAEQAVHDQTLDAAGERIRGIHGVHSGEVQGYGRDRVVFLGRCLGCRLASAR